MLKVIITSFALVLFFFLPVTASAHLGNGPPFMKVDGVYTQTNPYNQGSSTLTMSWDAAPKHYLINKPVTFLIDVPVLMSATTLPISFAKEIKIRWTVATGDNFEKKENTSASGNAYTRTFTKPGSYLIIVEAKLPADSDYILINTIQVDVLPNAAYHTPAPSAYVGTQNDDPGKNVLFVSDTLNDPSTKIKRYIWDFGENQLHDGPSIDRKLDRANSMGTETIFHRVIDGNGFVADVGFVADKVGDKLQFDPFAPGKPLPIVVVTREEAAKHENNAGGMKMNVPEFVGVVVGVLVLAGMSWMLVFKKKKTNNVA
jgi:hypothetical protein